VRRDDDQGKQKKYMIVTDEDVFQAEYKDATKTRCPGQDRRFGDLQLQAGERAIEEKLLFSPRQSKATQAAVG